jgi:Spy/CpxP family protein refolding chaperone
MLKDAVEALDVSPGALGQPSANRSTTLLSLRNRGTMMKKNLAFVLFGIAILAAPWAFAQDKTGDVTDMQALRKAVQADKKGLVASTLKLTDAEAKRFWPIYDAYQRDLDVANRRRVVAVEGLIGRDGPVSDLYARTLSNEFLIADETEIKLRRSLQNRLMRGVPTRVLPPKKAATYLQLEAKIRAAQAYDIATMIPLIR